MSQNLDELYSEVQKHVATPGFKALEKFLLIQIEKHRDTLEKGGGDGNTDNLRGRIKECRAIIKVLNE